MNLKGKRKAFFKYLTRKQDVLQVRIMKDNVNEDICRCHHVRSFHKNESLFCVASGWAHEFCNCTEYRPQDNLKFLELKYERSIP